LAFDTREGTQTGGVLERVLPVVFFTTAQRVLFAKYNWNVEVMEDEVGRGYSTNGDRRNAYRFMVGKPEEKRPVGKPRRRWLDNIKMGLGDIGWGCMKWADLAQDRGQVRVLVNMVMNLEVP
jgi:hypothetical protein